MDTSAILSAIDAEIDRLQQAREILAGLKSTSVDGLVKRGPGRPQVATVPPKRKKRVLSEEARARIAAGQKKRWAAQKS